MPPNELSVSPVSTVIGGEPSEDRRAAQPSPDVACIEKMLGRLSCRLIQIAFKRSS